MKHVRIITALLILMLAFECPVFAGEKQAGKCMSISREMDGSIHKAYASSKTTVYKEGEDYYSTAADGKSIKLKGVKAMAAERLLSKQVNLKLKKAFKWSAMEFLAVPAPKYKKESKIATYYGSFGFQNGRGDCNVQAYTFYYMADLLGYDVKVVRGYVRKSSGLSPHAWCEIRDKKGNVKVYDPNFNREYSKQLNNPNAGYGIKYGAKQTLQYYDAEKRLLS